MKFHRLSKPSFSQEMTNFCAKISQGIHGFMQIRYSTVNGRQWHLRRWLEFGQLAVRIRRLEVRAIESREEHYGACSTSCKAKPSSCYDCSSSSININSAQRDLGLNISTSRPRPDISGSSRSSLHVRSSDQHSARKPFRDHDWPQNARQTTKAPFLFSASVFIERTSTFDLVNKSLSTSLI